MKTPRQALPDFSAMNSITNARDAAHSVPIPLFTPLHRVAPVMPPREHRKLIILEGKHSLCNLQIKRDQSPAVNSSTTTTVITAHIAFRPTPSNSGSKRYNKETSVNATPTLRAWISRLGSSLPTSSALSHSLTGSLTIFSIESFVSSLHLVFLPLLSSAVPVSAMSTRGRWRYSRAEIYRETTRRASYAGGDSTKRGKKLHAFFPSQSHV